MIKLNWPVSLSWKWRRPWEFHQWPGVRLRITTVNDEVTLSDRLYIGDTCKLVDSHGNTLGIEILSGETVKFAGTWIACHICSACPDCTRDCCSDCARFCECEGHTCP